MTMNTQLECEECSCVAMNIQIGSDKCGLCL